MQFMSIFTWDPGKTAEAMEIRAVEKAPGGPIVINEWVDLGSSTIFRLVEVENSVTFLKAGYPRADPGYAGMYPIMEMKEASGQLER